MFLLFGIRGKDHFIGSAPGVCEVCGAYAAQTLVRRTTKFTLFFVPLFPVRPAQHFVACTNCGRTRHATRQEAVAA